MPDPSDTWRSSRTSEAGRDSRRKVPLMHVFRTAAASRDSQKIQGGAPQDDRELTNRGRESRDGMSEGDLRRNLMDDLASLMGTVRLDAAISLDDVPYVQKSVINYGFQDMSSTTASHMTAAKLIAAIRATLIAHEPRLIPETIDITLHEKANQQRQLLSFDITAEMASHPVDVAVEFLAEVDLGEGKLNMSQVQAGA